MTHRYDGSEEREFIEISNVARDKVFDLAASEGLSVSEAFGQYVENLLAGQSDESDE